MKNPLLCPRRGCGEAKRADRMAARNRVLCMSLLPVRRLEYIVHCNRIERLKTSYEVHGIPDYDRDTGYNIGWFKVDNTNEDNPSYDCGENVELFKALAAMNKNNWDEQYVIDNAGNIGLCNVIPDASGIQCRSIMMMGLSFNIDNYRKATVEEIVEYFKKQ